MTSRHSRDDDDAPAAFVSEGRTTDRHGSRRSTAETYHTVAETVGLVPSVRRRDNLVQGIAVAVGALVGAAVGWLWGSGLVSRIEAFTGVQGIAETHGPRVSGALFGAVAGLMASAVGSGLGLMVVGWLRAAGKRAAR